MRRTRLRNHSKNERLPGKLQFPAQIHDNVCSAVTFFTRSLFFQTSRHPDQLEEQASQTREDVPRRERAVDGGVQAHHRAIQRAAEEIQV